MNIIKLYDNKILPQNYCEIHYITKILENLYEYLDNSYVIVVVTGDEQLLNINLDKTKTNILIHVGNELKYNDINYHKFDYVFRFYHFDKVDNKKIFNINIGYNSSGYNEVYLNNNKKIKDRTYDIFFSGQLRNREDLNIACKNITVGNNLIRFTNGFRQGLNINEYYDILSDTKICLIPNGDSPETFRYNEAMSSGCIIISLKNIQNPYYKNSPIHLLNNWNELNNDLILNILKSDLETKQKEIIDFYNTNLSPNVMAKFIVNKIKNI